VGRFPASTLVAHQHTWQSTSEGGIENDVA